MSFPRYPSYKDSGVEWLGNVPAHWGVRRVRRIFEIKKRIAGELGHDVLSITQQGIKIRDIESNDGQLSMDYAKYQLVEIGDFAMNHMDLLTGYVDVCSERGVTSPDYRVFTIKNADICNSQYFLYLLQMGYKNRIFFAFGQGSSQMGRWRLPTDQFNDFSFPLPPLSEQVNIAALLNSETAKIDALVEQQRRLMDLLKEKRQTVISHAVTKGLNPDAPMKPSGIEWLGDIPKHWVQSRIKYSLRGLIDTEHKTVPFFDDGEYLVVRTTNIKDGKLVLDGGKYTKLEGYEEWTRRGKPQPGDIMFTREAPAGEACLVPEDIQLCMGQRTVLMQIDHDTLVSRFALWSLYGGLASEFITILSQGSTVAHFNMSDISNIPIMLPPVSEQVEIAVFLESELAKFDALTTETQRAIYLLQERRTALISAAVTGQIDVRGVVHADAQELAA